MLIGYARVSTGDQTLNLQKDALERAGCDQIFTDTISGTKSDRPGLSKALEFARKNDTLVVWRLDRLGRSLRHLIDMVNTLEERQIGFMSLTESIDTTTPGGRLIFHIFGSLAEFERALIVERTKAGLEAARARGRKGGRPRKLDDFQVELLRKMYADKSNNLDTLCKVFGISKPTLYRTVKEAPPP